jgi:hypothetical protein
VFTVAILVKDKIKAAIKLKIEVENHKEKGRPGSAAAYAAKKYNITRSAAQNYIKLLELPEGAQQFVSSGRLAMRNALAVLKAPKAQQESLAKLAVNADLNREDIISRILTTAKPLEEKATSKPTTPESDPDLKRLIEAMSEDLGTPVKIENASDNTGVVIVDTFFTEVFTHIIFSKGSSELTKSRCKIEANIDATHNDKQRGIIKFFFQNQLQKKLALIHIRQASIAYKNS